MGDWLVDGDAVLESVTQFLVAGQVAALIVIPLLALACRTTPLCRTVRRRRAFWCQLAAREIDVDFEERGLPGFERAVAVARCSVFEPPGAIECGRRCLDVSFRRRAESAPPIPGGSWP